MGSKYCGTFYNIVATYRNEQGGYELGVINAKYIIASELNWPLNSTGKSMIF